MSQKSNMPLVRPGAVLCGLLFFAAALILAHAPARADATVTLLGVTFADGGTASGYFVLNDYGYVEASDISTTAGTTPDNEPMPASGYHSAGSVISGPPAFDTLFAFNTPDQHFSLDLLTADPLSSLGGVDPLITGSGTFSGTSYTSLAGSYEVCSFACGGPADNDGRLVVAGSLDVTEPATLSILLCAIAALPVIRRRHVLPRRGAA